MIDCKTATLSEIQDALFAWQSHNFPQYFDGRLDNATLQKHLQWGVIEELGEFFHARLKMEQGIRGTKEKHEADMRDAIGDMLIYLSNLAEARGEKFKTIRMKSYSYPNLPLVIASGASTVWSITAVYGLATEVGLDAETCFRETATEVMKRDWIKFPKNAVTE